MESFSLNPLKICSNFNLKTIILKKEKSTRCTERTPLRVENNLKNRIQFLAIKINFSMNKMFICLLKLGYRAYVEKYEKDCDFKMEEEKILW